MLTKTLAQEVVGWQVDEYLFPLSKTGANYRLGIKKENG